nr:hypothetical protein [Tanacetum cinerariifolium]
MLNKENYVPWSSRLLWYAKSRPKGKLIHNSIINGPYVRRMILEPGDTNRKVPMNETFHVQTNDELTKKELKQIEADDQAIHTILLGLPEDIYAAVDSCETAQEIWLRVQQMIKGSDIGIQEKKAKLFNEWERFTSNDGESIESYYHRWSRHVTIVHQTKDLHTADYTQLYDFLKYNQKERISSNPRNRQIAQPGMNMGQDRQMQMVGVQNSRVQNIGNQNGLIGVPGNANQNLNGNGNLVAASDLNEIKEVNANCILLANLQQASTSGQSLNGKPKTGIAKPRSGGSVLNGENANPNLNNVSRKVDTTQPVIGTSVLEGMETGNTSSLTSENNTRVSPSFENPNDVNLTDQLGNETQIVDNIWGTTEVNENHEGPNTKSFVNVVMGTKPNSKINFRTLFNEERVENSDFVLPIENFSTTRGLEQVMEQGPWLIRNQPLILTQWTPNLNLEKNKVKKVPVWVKIHKVPVVAYSEDGHSLIGTQIDKPVMLDAFTSSMYTEVWGRMGFARALIEVDADRNLKVEVVMAVPRLEGEGHTIETMKASDGFTMVQNRRKKGKNVANGVPKASDKEFAMKIMNHFLALKDENITHHTNASDASTSDVQAENGATNVVDDDSEVEDLGNEYEVTKIKIGASTHPIKVPNV